MKTDFSFNERCFGWYSPSPYLLYAENNSFNQSASTIVSGFKITINFPLAFLIPILFPSQYPKFLSF